MAECCKFCHNTYDHAVTSMIMSLPDSLKAFVDEQVAQRGYGTGSEYVRELIRKEQDRTRLRELLLDGTDKVKVLFDINAGQFSMSGTGVKK